jgi:hypothetical protein
LGPYSLRALARQDHPVAEDLVFALSAVVGAGEFEGHPRFPAVRFAREIELRANFQIGLPTATEPDLAVVRGQVDLAERVKAVFSRGDPVTLDFEARAVRDDFRRAGFPLAEAAAEGVGPIIEEFTRRVCLRRVTCVRPNCRRTFPLFVVVGILER